MNLPTVVSYEEQAIDTVVYVINKAKDRLGKRQTLRELIKTRAEIAPRSRFPFSGLTHPLPKSIEKLLCNAIEKKWKLTPTLKYILNYKDSTRDETSQYYYYEAIFSQPTISYPIPQATASVFFRVRERLIVPPEERGVPSIFFRIEGHQTDHDVRFVALTVDWILAVIQMKLKVFERIEKIRLF